MPGRVRRRRRPVPAFGLCDGQFATLEPTRPTRVGRLVAESAGLSCEPAVRDLLEVEQDPLEEATVSNTTLLVLIVLALLMFGGGGGYYWRSRR